MLIKKKFHQLKNILDIAFYYCSWFVKIHEKFTSIIMKCYNLCRKTRVVVFLYALVFWLGPFQEKTEVQEKNRSGLRCVFHVYMGYTQGK